MFTGSKKIFVIPGHDKLEVPMVDKKKAQVLSISDENLSVMDMESFETLDVPTRAELKGQIAENDNIE